jgi:ribosome biogenesis GTPase
VLVDRGRYRVLLAADAAGPEGTVVAVRARELGRGSLVVGDQVGVVGDVSGAPDSLARIVLVQQRSTTLRRTADDNDPVERVIVANAEQLAVVVAAAEPAPRLKFVDRAIVAALDGGMHPVLLVTKTDLAPADDIARVYAGLGIDLLPVRRGGDLAAVRRQLAGRRTVLIGQSGVGKSTLVNALVPDAERATGVVNDVTGRGRHTSTSVQALPLPGGGWIVDTPGIRSFGLAHVDPDRIIHAFADLEPGARDCPRACRHLDEHCALPQYAASGAAGPGAVQRLESLRRLMGAVLGAPVDDLGGD